MTNSLHVGAEFDSFDAFEHALNNYCASTNVNGLPVSFVNSSAKFIKNEFTDEVKSILKYIYKFGCCKFRPKKKGQNGCSAYYKLELRTKLNDERVLRLVIFDENHTNHVINPLPIQSNDSRGSNDELSNVLTNILKVANGLPEARRNKTVEILQNLLNHMQAHDGFNVSFGRPVANSRVNNSAMVNVIHDTSRTPKFTLTLGENKCNGPTISLLSDDDDDDEEEDTHTSTQTEQSELSMPSTSTNHKTYELPKSSTPLLTEPDNMQHVDIIPSVGENLVQRRSEGNVDIDGFESDDSDFEGSLYTSNDLHTAKDKEKEPFNIAITTSSASQAKDGIDDGSFKNCDKPIELEDKQDEQSNDIEMDEPPTIHTPPILSRLGLAQKRPRVNHTLTHNGPFKAPRLHQETSADENVSPNIGRQPDRLELGASLQLYLN